MFRFIDKDVDHFFLGDCMIKSFWKDAQSKSVSFYDEDQKAYYLTIQAAGFKKEDLTIQVEGRTLKIKGNSSNKKIPTSMNYHFTPPRAIDHHSNITAHLEDGILTITLPKKDSETTTIPIE